MAATSRKADDIPRETGFSAPMDFEDFSEINYTALNAAGAIGQRWYEMINEINSEMIGFLNTRMKEDVTIPTSLAKCRTGEEMFEFCSDYFRTAVGQYFDEAEKLSHIGSDFVGKATRVVEAEAKEVHDIAAD